MGIQGPEKAPFPKDTWHDAGDYWAVPRFWGQQNFKGKNKTVRPRAKWTPKIEFEARHNQSEVISDCLKTLKSINGVLLEAKTAYGKTVTALQIAAQMNTKVMLVADETDLIDQWETEYKSFFEGEVGRVQGDQLNYDTNLTVATSQTLYSRYESLPKKFWKSFGMVIIDEGHSFSCDSFFTSVNKFHARYRFAVSATWRRKDLLDPLWELALSDQYVKGVRSDNLTKNYKIVNHNYGFDKISFMSRRKWSPGLDFNKILSTLAECDEYNDYLASTIESLISEGRNVVLACKRTHQIEQIEDRLKLKGITCGIYAGKHRGKSVKKAELESAKDANPILATFSKIEKGTNIPRLDCLIIASPISDPEQLIGRVTREYPNKLDCLVMDMRFPEIKYLNGQNRNKDKLFKKLGWNLII